MQPNIMGRRRWKTTVLGTLSFMPEDRQSLARYNDHPG